jgi:ABC-type phosphate transport system substrate-binding protein
MSCRTTALLVMAIAAGAPQTMSHAAPMQARTGEPLAIIVHRSNPVDGVSLRELRRIFMLDTQTWPNGRKITVVLREAGQPERRQAIELICVMSELDYDRHVFLQTFRGHVGSAPRSIRSASAMLRFVFNAPGAIGYVRASEVDDTTKVLRIDGLLPDDTGYPLRLPAARPPAAPGGGR